MRPAMSRLRERCSVTLTFDSEGLGTVGLRRPMRPGGCGFVSSSSLSIAHGHSVCPLDRRSDVDGLVRDRPMGAAVPALSTSAMWT